MQVQPKADACSEPHHCLHHSPVHTHVMLPPPPNQPSQALTCSRMTVLACAAATVSRSWGRAGGSAAVDSSFRHPLMMQGCRRVPRVLVSPWLKHPTSTTTPKHHSFLPLQSTVLHTE